MFYRTLKVYIDLICALIREINYKIDYEKWFKLIYII